MTEHGSRLRPVPAGLRREIQTRGYLSASTMDHDEPVPEDAALIVRRRNRRARAATDAVLGVE